MMEIRYLTVDELEAGLVHIRQSPRDEGRIDLIVRRPQVDEREVIVEGELDLGHGLVGDSWLARGSRGTPDGAAHPETQLNLMNARVIALLAQSPERWALAGDQFFIDLDLSTENLPPGTRLAMGTAVIEITAQPHTGCGKFASRFGPAATKFVNSPQGKLLRLRGVNARVVQPGVVRVGETVRKLY